MAAIAFIILVIAGVISAIVDKDDSGRGVAPATSGKTVAASQAPTATLTSAQRDQMYPPLPDVRELVTRPGESFGKRMQFTGEIMTLQVAPANRIYKVGNQKTREVETIIYVRVTSPVGSTETVLIGYDGSTSGMFENSKIVVYGTMVDTDSNGENAFGHEVTVPLVIADLVTEPTI